MKIKFSNPTEKHVWFHLGNLDEGDLVSINIPPNSFVEYGLSQENLDRFSRAFSDAMEKFEIKYERL
jgi:hypothetical protein